MSAPTDQPRFTPPQPVTGPSSPEKPRSWQVTDGYTRAAGPWHAPRRRHGR
ncbi:hypothetical protein [Nesterenkonia pannonica]|uniref:hypothetical protein n=1 Tax=Nesterenkonia pannonica TaxID=1548602 RepID=UPI002164B32A|nr:hypothetical protein [Nesterenkonia pannonica]